MNPTASCNFLFLLNAPCPHSCANTHSPIATVPVTAEYAAQMGRVKMEVPIVPIIAAPTAVHRAVLARDMERYPNDFAVSGSKQSVGMTALRSLDWGKSSALSESAFPLSP